MSDDYKCYSRANEYYALYPKFIMDRLRKVKELDAELTALTDSDSTMFERFSIEDNLFIQSSVVVVFSTIFLEGLIFDYGAIHLGDKFMREHLDRLSLPSKMILIPKLVAGYDFPKNTMAYKQLKTLVTNRNKLVHSKSKQMPFTDTGEYDYVQIQKWDSKAAAIDANKALIYCMQELAKIGNYNIPFVEYFENVFLLE